MAITENELKAADERGAALRAGMPTAVSAHYDQPLGQLQINLSNGVTLAFHPNRAQGLEGARPCDLATIHISPTGLGLHFPALDADLYLPGLLEGLFGSRNWMAAQMGQAGGRVKSEAKSAAARANGRRGGRPRKGTSAPEETIPE